jgi:hypothetical protein
LIDFVNEMPQKHDVKLLAGAELRLQCLERRTPVSFIVQDFNFTPLVVTHLAKIQASPNDTSVSHWKREIRNWLNIMEAMLSHVGKKTAGEWQERIQTFRATLGDEKAETK